MKLTKKQLAEARKVYDTFWDSYQTGDVDTFAATLDDNFEMIGTSESERCHTKAAGIEFYKGQVEEVVGKAELRNRQISATPVDGLVLVNELSDIYILAETDWRFYSKIRISTLLRKTSDGWKVAQQHGSLPDMRVEGDETIAIDKISRENIELRDAIKRRTIELEEKNRELEIEASLERVRAVAMSMHTTDDLKRVGEIIFAELKSLGFADLGNTVILINNDQKESVLSYYYSGYGVSGAIEVFYNDHPVLKKWAQEMQKASDAFAEIIIPENEMAAWKKYREEIGYAPDPKLEAAKSVCYYSYSTGLGALSVSSFTPITGEQRNVLARFRNVFALAYRRYVDVAQAEAQAREAQIEAALERVRSRSLAMHHTAELQDVIHTVHQELLNLNLSISGGSFIAINSDIDTEIHCWGSGGTADTSEEVHIPRFEKPFYTNLIKGIKKGPGLFTEEYTQKEKREFFTFLFKHEPWSKLDSKQKKETLTSPGGYTRSCYVSPNTSIIIINHFGKPFSEVENNILIRFGKVFEQSYTRFLDLQKAEAQAREAEIELALERVRARTMAMQKSEELKEVIQLVYEQFVQLNIFIEHTGFIMDYKARDDMNIWLADQNGAPSQVTIPYFDSPHWNSFNEAKEKGIDCFANHLTFEEKNRFYKKLFRYIPELSEEAKEFYFSCPGLAISTVLLENVGLYIENFSGIPYSDEENNTLMRFGNVFQQTYTRFLDLQKAEAQAREGQINLAVERVRARALAMFKSEEILDVVHKLKEEIMGLDIPHVIAATIHLKEEDGRRRIWDITSVEMDGDSIHQPLDVRYRLEETDPDFFMRRIWENTENYFLVVQAEEDFKCTIQWLRDCGRDQQADATEQFLAATKLQKLYHPTVQLANGRMCIDTLEPPAGEVESILTKMGAAFDLAYKRFEDLQKAEAQAREAEIQLALERVRARSMAMHKSDELADLSLELVKRVHALGVETWFCAFNIYDDDPAGSLEWGSNGQGTFPQYRTPREGIFLDYYEAGQRGETLLINEISEDECPAHYDYLCSLPGVGEQLLKIKDEGIPFPTSQIDHVAYFKYGYIIFITFEPAPEAHQIFKRFANVFEQTYTRFLDLQKAEAQAREAEIELALERVRARTMAMQHSDELKDAAALLFQQVKALGVPAFSCGYNIWEKDEKECTAWMSTPDGSGINPAFKIPLTEDPNFIRFYASRQQGEDFYVLEMRGERMQEHYRYLRKTIPVFDNVFNEIEQGGHSLPETQMHHLVNFSHGNVMFITLEPCPEAHDIFKRFGKVFEQTYIRFLDLQKAEAQAREAQIEAALERVRSRSLAMHKTDELQEVVRVLAEELKNTGVILDTGGAVICTYFQDSKDVIHWTATEDPAHPSVPYLLHYFKDELFDEAWASKNRGDEYFAKVFSYDVKNAFFNYAFEHSDYRQLPDEYKKIILESKSHGLAWAWSENSAIMIPSIQGDLPNEEEKEILIRFAKVFEQSFIRFLDLQKAEEQAREAKIELSLERIRAQVTAMQESSDLLDIVVTMRTEFVSLGHEAHYFWHMRWLPDRYEKAMTSGDGSRIGNVMELPRGFHEDQRMLDWEKTKEPIGIFTYDGDAAVDYVDKMIRKGRFDQIDHNAPGPDDIRAIGGLTFVMARTTHGEIGYSLPGMVPDPPAEDLATLVRFAGVFDLAYRRFEDLKKAELQKREAEIELALERVRARTMAMQHSHELNEAAFELFEQLRSLGGNLWGTGFGFCEEDSETDEFWFANEKGVLPPVSIPNTDDPAHKRMYRGWKQKADFLAIEESGKALKSHYDYMLSLPDVKPFFQEILDAGLSFPDWQQWNAAYFSHGYLLVITVEPYPDEQILKRFAKVFKQTYTRFLDLKKAEAQAREAQVEAALERARSQSMLMQHSSELNNVSNVFHEQLLWLGIPTEFSYVWLPDEANELHQFWATWAEEKKKTTHFKTKAVTYPLDRSEPYTAACFTAWESNEPIHIAQIAPAEVDNFFATWKELLHGAEKLKPEFFPDGLYYAEAYMKYGCFGINIRRLLTEDEKQILLRFSVEFERAYRRFLDLQQAEARAREAEQQASLDRVRAEIASMRTAKDLERITPLIWRELTTLGVPFFRCGVFIIDEATEQAHVYLSTPKGKSLAVMRMDFDSSTLVTQTVEHWRRKQIYREQWDKKQFIAWTQSLVEQGFIKNHRKYQAGEAAPEKLALQFVPFAQGMLYIGSAAPLSDDEIALTQTLADAFAVAYARYDDFQRLEAAKAEIEAALENLKKTQGQLVQAEKMASLGQLTAGIAHEIKNPLNFVTNFAQLSSELIDELSEELHANPDKSIADLRDLLDELLTDLRANNEKINEHGKRADSIVKSMMQHARGGKNERQPTELNALVEEYLNLTYHGMRARVANFNVSIERDFGEIDGKVEMVPQEIGRVLLNIMGNACDAVHQRAQSEGEAYQPKLSVATRRVAAGIEIRIGDNGGGISDEIREKIFEPFFTTKPTGSGTGLGLSLSYDIVTHGHGGTLTMESSPDEGASFIITLPGFSP